MYWPEYHRCRCWCKKQPALSSKLQYALASRPRRQRPRCLIPLLALLANGGPIEPTDYVNLAVHRIINSVREIPAIMICYRRAHAPGVCRDIVDVRLRQDIEVRIEAAEDINLVRVRGVSDTCIIEASCHIRQRRPGVRDRVVPVKGVSWEAERNAAC